MCSSTPCLPVVDVERFTTLSTTARVTTIADGDDGITITSDTTTLEDAISLQPNTSISASNFQSSTEISSTNKGRLPSTTNPAAQKQEGKSLK